MKRKLIITLLSTFLVVDGSPWVRAAAKGELNASIAAMTAAAIQHPDREHVLAKIASQTRTRVETLRTYLATNGLTYGEAFAAAEIARTSGHAFAEVVAEHRAGRTWAEVAARLRVEADLLVRSAHRVRAAIDRDRKTVEARAAKERRNLEEKVATINAAAKRSEARVMARIAATTGIAEARLRETMRSHAMTHGDLFVAAEISRASGKAFADVVAAHQSGRDWAKVASDNQVQVGKLVSSASSVHADIVRGPGTVGFQSTGQFGATAGPGRTSGAVGVGSTTTFAPPPVTVRPIVTAPPPLPVVPSLPK